MAHGTRSNGTNGTGKKDHGTLVDFTQVREKRLEEKKRQNERVFFRNLISVFSVGGEHTKPAPIELIEVSEEGLSFRVPAGSPNNPTDKTLPLRFYFSPDTYLEVLVEIKNSRPSIEEGSRFTRYGCLIDVNTQSYTAYRSFVQFLKEYAKHSHRDMGDVTAFYR